MRHGSYENKQEDIIGSSCYLCCFPRRWNTVNRHGCKESGSDRVSLHYSFYCEFAASRQPCFCYSALIWSILSMISCRLCSVEVCFSSSSSTFNSPASCSQSAIGLFLPCVAINATRGEPFRVSTWPFVRRMSRWHDRRWHSRFRLSRRTPQHNGCRLAHMPRKQSRTQASCAS